MKQNNDFDDSLEDDENKFTPLSPRELQSKSKEQVKNFGELLESLDSSLDKKKRLWRTIFENAIQDRNNAHIIFTDLLIHVHTKAEQHAIHGQNLSKYLERMSKSTDQLLKLAELVAAAEEKFQKPDEEEDDEEVDPDEIYKKINGDNSSSNN